MSTQPSPIPEYTLIRSRRRSISLEVTSEARLVVRAPFKVSLTSLNEVLNRHALWIQKKLTVAEARSPRRLPRQYVEGELFDFLGKEFPLRIVSRRALRELSPLDSGGTESRLVLTDYLYFAPESLSPLGYSRYFEQWYKQQARQLFQQRLQALADQYGYQFSSLKLSSAKNRWGSCGPGGSINLNWRLIMAPLEVIDYVILHELTHTVHPNHSRRFWLAVANYLPDYRTKRRWLKENGQRLLL